MENRAKIIYSDTMHNNISLFNDRSKWVLVPIFIIFEGVKNKFCQKILILSFYEQKFSWTFNVSNLTNM